MTEQTDLTSYRLLGRSGLKISPPALGTMTFGKDWSWGAEESEARRIFDTYVDRGGNFIDTANAYTNGSSVRLVVGLSNASATGSSSPSSTPWRRTLEIRTRAAITARAGLR